MAEPTPPAGQQPPAGRQPPGSDTLGLMALILGVLSLPLVFCFALGLPVGAAAVILGAIGLYRVNQGRASNRNQALAGLVLGAIAIIAIVVIIALPD